ncbi:hypothetical protein JD844_023884 [Phrynosoma platyrhinos]|uniref:Muscular LMNA-interacting protein n=1 Tax=Phrynosoma platyrhinos TaxID=52577 RepID=A0ABQ7SXB1_PHRPL|nr:hypothetical protein JD844_023884 [Phrynosoma platyrhinos]
MNWEIGTKQNVPSESGFLKFTFVPTFGSLPTQHHIVDAPSSLAEIGGNHQENTRNRHRTGAEDQATGSGKKGNSSRNSGQNLSQPKEHNTSRGEMDKEDLFKAEFIILADSDEDTKAAMRNGYGMERTELLATAGASSNEQLTSPLSTSDHLSHKSPTAHFLSPTNMKVNHELASSGLKASSVQESHSQWRSANGSSIHQSSTYFHSSTSSSLPSSILKRPSFPFNSLSASAQLTSDLQTNVPHQLTEGTSSPLLASKDSPYPSSQIHSSADMVCSSSPKVVSPLPSKRLTTWSVVPVSITTHLLSPSPKPLSSPLHGSSSTIYSVNNPCSQMSSSGNLLTSGSRAPLPTRLSVLTAILKSGSSPKRPFSPVSCSATLSPNSLGSSTLTIDQKLKTTPPTPKKSSSSFSVRSGSPNQDGFHLSVFSNVPDHTSLSSKSSPNLGTRSVSPKRHLDTRALSPDKLRPLSPRISSYRKTTVSPLLQSKSPNFSLPPHGPRKGALSPSHGTQGPDKSKKIRTYSPTFTAKSIPVLMPVLSQKDRVSPTSEKGCLSPNLMHSSNQSKGRLQPVSAKDADACFSAPSSCQPFSQTGPASPTPPVCSMKPSPPQPNSSSVYSNFRACPPSSRPRTPTVTQPKSPTMVHSSYSSSSRSKESTSPLSFSMPSDSKILKALDEPTIGEGMVEDRALDTHPENYLNHGAVNSNLLINLCLQSPTPLQRPAGRETRFANLYLSGPAVTESQKTKPGVIRPTMVKAKIIVKEEEPVQPNPFKKYLEETIDLQTEQDSSPSHPFLQTKLNPLTKSPLHLQAVSHADSLTPGPFNHLASIFDDVHNNSYSPYHCNTLYNKPTHPIVPIPEDEALSSKELCSAIIKDNMHLPLYQEKKDARKENFPGNERSPHSRAQCLLRGDFGNGVEKPC